MLGGRGEEGVEGGRPARDHRRPAQGQERGDDGGHERPVGGVQGGGRGEGAHSTNESHKGDRAGGVGHGPARRVGQDGRRPGDVRDEEGGVQESVRPARRRRPCRAQGAGRHGPDGRPPSPQGAQGGQVDFGEEQAGRDGEGPGRAQAGEGGQETGGGRDGRQGEDAGADGGAGDQGCRAGGGAGGVAQVGAQVGEEAGGRGGGGERGGRGRDRKSTRLNSSH